ncbi:hypothetical protein [Salinibacter altiplanensis]|uniref:hypothetical protein n=1 Tax=Salinibacter altiplanensis TaxID=1803181 RepID=UPI001F244DCD|nr:hypothetical protein [Salinibacter altiplanensis]
MNTVAISSKRNLTRLMPNTGSNGSNESGSNESGSNESGSNRSGSSEGSIREEMQREREQLSESKKRLQSMGETLNQLTEKVGQLAKTVSQLVESQSEEDRLDRESLRKELQEAIPKEIQELKSTLQKMIEEGVPLEGKKEFRQMKKKVGQLVSEVNTKAELLASEVERQDRVNEAVSSVKEALGDLKNEKREMKNDHSSLLRRLEKTAGALETRWWRRVWTGMLGGALGVLVLAGVGWASTETLPQEWRMIPEEVRQIEGTKRLRNATRDHLTEEEYETYRKLLKKAYRRDQDSQQ